MDLVEDIVTNNVAWRLDSHVLFEVSKVSQEYTPWN